MCGGFGSTWLTRIASLATLACALSNAAMAANPDAGTRPPAEKLRFQRVFVPADRPEDWPRDLSQRYLPMSAEEFERRVRPLTNDDQQQVATSDAQLLNAEYAAELIEDNLTNATATWEFGLRGKSRAVMLLDNTGLPIESAEWIDSKQPAVVGNDGRGRLAVVVEASGKMRCRWSLRGQRNSTGALRYDLSLPKCPVNSLLLTLPADLAPTVDYGLVSQASAAPRDDGKQVWRLELGGHSQVRLLVAPRQATQSGQPQPLVRSNYVYEFSEAGLELNADFRLDSIVDSVQQLSLLTDPQLTIVSVQLDGTDLPVAMGAGTVDGLQPYTLQFLEPVEGRDRRLRVKAVSAIDYGKPERLPMLRVADARWQQGTASLIVAPPLVLQDLRTVDCRQLDAESLAAPLQRTAVSLQFLNESPQVHLQLSPRRDQVEITSGTSLSLRANQAVGHFRAELTAQSGQRFALEAEVAAQWIIDTVEATPLDESRSRAAPAAPEDYPVLPTSSTVELVEDWSFGAPRGRNGKLKIELKSPLTPERGIALKVTGRRRRARSRESLSVGDLRMLEFSDVAPLRRILQVQAVEGFQIATTGGDKLHRLNSDQLLPADAALLDAAPSGLIFVDDQESRNLGVVAVAQPPKFTAEVQAEADLHAGRLTESYQFKILPLGQELDRLIIHFTQPREEALQWAFADDATAEIISRRLGDDDQSQLGISEGETWELKLPVPRSKGFELNAERSRPFHSDTPVALASVVDAESQKCIIQVRCSQQFTPEIRSRRLKSIPVEPTSPNQVPTVLAAFRFDPEESSLVSIEPPLVLAPRLEPPAGAAAWIWRAALQSRYYELGSEHVLTCQVESAGGDRMLFQLPAGGELRGAWIDDRVALDPARTDPQRCQINLPVDERFVTIVLHWIDEQSALRDSAPVLAPWPECTAPILSRQWDVALPPGDQIVQADFGGGAQGTVSWLRRLFGPLTRTADGPYLPIEEGTNPSAKHQNAAANGADETAVLPWKNSSKDRIADVEGWSTYRFECPPEQRSAAWIMNQRNSLIWFWAMLAMAAAIRWWIGSRRLAFEVGLITLATAAAMVAPPIWTTISAGIWLGVLSAQLCLWWRPRLFAENSFAAAAERSSIRRNLTVVATTATLAIVFLWQGLSWGQVSKEAKPAQEPTATAPRLRQSQETKSQETNSQPDRHSLPPPAPRSPEAHRVLIPVDDQGEPTGGLYYLSETFHTDLIRATAASDLPPPRYLFVSALYTATLNADVSAKELESGAWKAVYEIESLVDHAGVELPLGIEGATLEPDGLKLDDQSANFHWNESHHDIVVDVARAGRHRLEVFFRPQRNVVGYDFAVPTVAHAELNLAISGDASSVVVPALGAKRVSDKSRVSVALGPAPRIVVQEAAATQPAVTTNEPANVKFECDQLCWLRVRPGGVALDARFKFKIQQGQLSQVRLSVDPRLRLLPATSGGGPSKYSAMESEPGQVIVDWSEPMHGQTAIDLSFGLAESTDVGHHYLPFVELRNGKTGRKWWAITVEPGLEFTEVPATDGAKLPVDEFLAAWGTVQAKPQLALAQVKALPEWHIAVRPAPMKISANYQLTAIAQAKSVEVHWLANIAADRSLFQYHLVVPDDLEVDEISMSDEAVRQPLRWSRCRPNSATAFLDARLIGERKLLLRGRVPLARNGHFTLPELRLEGCQQEQFQSLILRRSDARVEITNLAGATSLENDELLNLFAKAKQQGGSIAGASLAGARIVAGLNSGEEYRAVETIVERNMPRLAVTQLTSLVRESDRWRAAVELSLRIRGGMVDELRFDLPPTWTGPFEITPVIPYSVEETSGDGRKQLVIRPDSPLSDTVRLQIAAPLTLAVGQRPALPQVRLLGVESQTHYFLLPRRYEKQQLSWDIPGMIDRPLPEGWLPAGLDAKNYRSLQQVSARCRAELRSVEREAGKPQVRLADFAISGQADGSEVGVAAFDLEPAGATSCPLELPAASRLICVRLDGLPAQLSAQTDHRWNVWLGDNNLPRRLEVIYCQQKLDDTSTSRGLKTPMLVGVPVARALWKVFSAMEDGAAEPASGSTIANFRYQLYRYECTAGLLRSAGKLLKEEPVENVGRWYSPWAERLQLSRATAEREQQIESASMSADEKSRLAAVESEQLKLARSLGVSEVLTRRPVGRPIAAEPIELLSSLQMADRPITRVTSAGGEPTPGLDFPRRKPNADWARGAWAVTSLLIGGMLTIAIGRRQVSFREVRFLPEAIGVLVGLVWWFWLTPSILGPPMIAFSVWAAWREQRRYRRRQAGLEVARIHDSPSTRPRTRPRVGS